MFFSDGGVTISEMSFYWSWILSVFSNAGLWVSALLSGIARCTARTCYLVNNTASDHLLHGWYERRHGGS